MAITCPVDLDTLRLRSEIQSIYARVAADPSGAFHFHRGAEYAATRLGYDAADGDRVVRRRREPPRDRAAAGGRHGCRHWIRCRYGPPAGRAPRRPTRP